MAQLSNVDKAFAQAVDSKAMPGIVAIAATDKGRVYEGAFGKRELGKDAQMTLDFHGNVQLCCGTYDTRRFTLGKYLELSFDELQARKYEHAMCGTCMRRGVHMYGTYAGPEYDDIAERTLGPELVQLIHLKRERRRKRVRRGVEWLYRNTAGRYKSRLASRVAKKSAAA